MKTTKHHFEIFKREAIRWIKRFGLLSSKHWFEHKLIDDEETIAQCLYSPDINERTFCLRLNKSPESTLSVQDIKETAFHEVMEAFYSRIKLLALNRHTTEEQINDEIHRMIMTMENVIFRDGKI